MVSYVIPPFSTALLNPGLIYPNYITLIGGGVQRYRGIAVAGTGNINATGELAFQIPQGLPSGTPYLRGYATTNVTGVASFDVQWVSFGSGQNPALQTPVSEGTGTITWTASGTLQPISIQLDAYSSGILAGNIVAMDIRFVTPCTLTQSSNWRFWIEYIQ